MDIIQEFNRVRDIPYRIPLSLKEKNQSCAGKSIELFGIFEQAGYEVRYQVVAFDWSSLNLAQKVLKMPHQDESTHVYLEVKIDDRWVVVDPTWDSGLMSILPVNTWDGYSDTQVAVPILEKFSLDESVDIMMQPESEALFNEDIERNGLFYEALNNWLEEVRKGV